MPINVEDLSVAFNQIESQNLRVLNIIVNREQYYEIRLSDIRERRFNIVNWSRDSIDIATQREILQSGLMGHFKTADIHISSVQGRSRDLIKRREWFMSTVTDGTKFKG